MGDDSKDQPQMTAGLDLGDKYSYLCLIDTVNGEVIEEGLLCAPAPKPSGVASLRSGLCASPWRRGPTRPGSAGSWRSAATRCWWPTLADCGSSTQTSARPTRSTPRTWLGWHASIRSCCTHSG